MTKLFNLVSNYKLSGDQPEATQKLLDGLNNNKKTQTLLGITGSGKTFTMANIIKEYNKPTLIISHNKTLAAQLYSEFKEYFPDNSVNYFISYFDYYQPEAYLPSTDTYIEKDSKINDQIDKLRHLATDSLLTRRDVIIIASVSCIYGIGSVENYANLKISLNINQKTVRDKFLRHLTDIQYQRNDIDFHRSTFRVRGDVVDLFLASDDLAYRIEFFGDTVEKISKINPYTGEYLGNQESLTIFPGSHFVTPKEKINQVIINIEQELEQRLKYFKKNNKFLEAQRLEQRTRFDLEMLKETGFVKGIENYSRYITDREANEQPATLLDYFPDDYLLFIDESHMSMPQIRGMYNGDRARKEVLVDYGFRLPSALDNRPLTFVEFNKHINQVIYVSATPAEYELSQSNQVVSQIIRPTNLLDPSIDIYPTKDQIEVILKEVAKRVKLGQRTLITTLTKRMAENLSEYLVEHGYKACYLHSDIATLERSDILNSLRSGQYDILVGINLLREGLDLPEVSLVIILDADKEGFLRSEQALIQIIGRAARHQEGHVIMFADQMTKSIKNAINITKNRRQKQEAYNKAHNLKPKSIQKDIRTSFADIKESKAVDNFSKDLKINKLTKHEKENLIKELTNQMNLASSNLQFEEALELRDLIKKIKL